MSKSLAAAGGHHAAIMYDNHIMTGPATPPLRRLFQAPFSRRAWAGLGYTLISVPLALAGFIFTVAGIGNGPLWAASALGVRKFGAASRLLAGKLLGENVPAPPRLRPRPSVRAETPDPARLAAAAAAAGARSRQWESGRGVTIRNLSASRAAELAAEAGVTVGTMRSSGKLAWYVGAMYDQPAWRARLYFAAKLPLAVAGLIVAGGCWLGGLFLLTFPAWRELALFGGFHVVSLASSFLLVPAGAALLLAGPWLLHGVTAADRYLIRGLLGLPSRA
jgi:hypothetical protein